MAATAGILIEANAAGRTGEGGGGGGCGRGGVRGGEGRKGGVGGGGAPRRGRPMPHRLSGHLSPCESAVWRGAVGARVGGAAASPRALCGHCFCTTPHDAAPRAPRRRHHCRHRHHRHGAATSAVVSIAAALASPGCWVATRTPLATALLAAPGRYVGGCDVGGWVLQVYCTLVERESSPRWGEGERKVGGKRNGGAHGDSGARKRERKMQPTEGGAHRCPPCPCPYPQRQRGKKKQQKNTRGVTVVPPSPAHASPLGLSHGTSFPAHHATDLGAVLPAAPLPAVASQPTDVLLSRHSCPSHGCGTPPPAATAEVAREE